MVSNSILLYSNNLLFILKISAIIFNLQKIKRKDTIFILIFCSVFFGLKVCFNEVCAVSESSTRLSGGGWAKPKNGEAYFLARVGDAV